MPKNDGPALPEDQYLLESEKQIADYLFRCGLVPEPGHEEENYAARLQRQREDNYHNVTSLLTRYRILRRTHETYQRALKEMLEMKENPSEKFYFTALSERLEINALTDEKEFRRLYAPQIDAGKRIESALNALDFGLEMLKAQDPDDYKLIYLKYIEGEKPPTINELLETIGCASRSTLYARLAKAEKNLAVCMFGFASNKAELRSLLVYLRQQIEDDYFPDYL